MAISKISTSQVKAIYTLANELGLVDRMATVDGLHEMICIIAQKESVTKLTSAEAVLVIDRLKGNMKGSNRIQPPSPVHRSGMASEAQIKMIWRQMYLLKELDPPGTIEDIHQRLRGFLKKYANRDDIKFLTSADANSAIEGLKGLVATEKKKAVKSGMIGGLKSDKRTVEKG